MLFTRTLVTSGVTPFYLFSAPLVAWSIKHNVLSVNEPRFQVLHTGRPFKSFDKASDMVDFLAEKGFPFTWEDHEYEKLKAKIAKSGHSIKVSAETGEIKYHGKRIVFIDGEWCAYIGRGLKFSYPTLEACLNKVIESLDPTPFMEAELAK